MLRFGLLICVCLFFLGCALLFAFGSAGSPCFCLYRMKYIYIYIYSIYIIYCMKLRAAYAQIRQPGT